MSIPSHIDLTNPAHTPAIKAEHSRLGEYLKDPGAGRDAACRSAEAMADQRELSKAYLTHTGVQL